MNKFLSKASSSDGTIKGDLQGISETNQPKQKSTNLRHKFLYSLKQAYPSFDKDIIGLILDHPDQLGSATFLDTLHTEVSKVVRLKVGEIIANLVQTTDQLKDITIELSKAFLKDQELYCCLKELGSDWKVTAYRLQKLVIFLKDKKLRE